MRQTVVGVFERYATARQAAQQLRESGFGESVFVTDEITAADADASHAPPDEPRAGGGLIAQVRDFFADLFEDKDDNVSPYAEALRRGGGVVKVEVTADSEVDAVRAALEDAGAMDIDECASEWRAAGWQGSAGPRREPATDADRDRTGGTAEQVPSADPVDAARTRRTGVRIYPRPLPDSALGGDPEPPQVAPARAGVGESHATYQSHFDANFARTGARWDEFEPAYRYGDAARSDIRYSGLGWIEVEPDLRQEWESRNAGPWDRFKAAIRRGWDRPSAE